MPEQLRISRVQASTGGRIIVRYSHPEVPHLAHVHIGHHIAGRIDTAEAGTRPGLEAAYQQAGLMNLALFDGQHSSESDIVASAQPFNGFLADAAYPAARR